LPLSARLLGERAEAREGEWPRSLSRRLADPPGEPVRSEGGLSGFGARPHAAAPLDGDARRVAPQIIRAAAREALRARGQPKIGHPPSKGALAALLEQLREG